MSHYGTERFNQMRKTAVGRLNIRKSKEMAVDLVFDSKEESNRKITNIVGKDKLFDFILMSPSLRVRIDKKRHQLVPKLKMLDEDEIFDTLIDHQLEIERNLIDFEIDREYEVEEDRRQKAIMIDADVMHASVSITAEVLNTEYDELKIIDGLRDGDLVIDYDHNGGSQKCIIIPDSKTVVAVIKDTAMSGNFENIR